MLTCLAPFNGTRMQETSAQGGEKLSPHQHGQMKMQKHLHGVEAKGNTAEIKSNNNKSIGKNPYRDLQDIRGTLPHLPTHSTSLISSSTALPCSLLLSHTGLLTLLQTSKLNSHLRAFASSAWTLALGQPAEDETVGSTDRVIPISRPASPHQSTS